MAHRLVAQAPCHRNPIAERTVNGMEALIELARLIELLNNPAAVMPTNPREAVLHYFGLPPLDAMERMDDEERKVIRERVKRGTTPAEHPPGL